MKMHQLAVLQGSFKIIIIFIINFVCSNLQIHLKLDGRNNMKIQQGANN